MPGLDVGGGYLPPTGPIHPEIRHPEWQGSIPSKWMDRYTNMPQMRRIVSTCCRNGDAVSFARQGPGGYFADVRGLDIIEGKRYIPCQQSRVQEWRPAKRSLSEPGASHWEKPEGLRRVESKPAAVRYRKEKLHIRQNESKEEFSDRPQGLNIVRAPNGLRAAEQTAQEIDLSRVIQRKHRLDHLEDIRNRIPVRSLGDKQYRHPEYCSEFFKAGGLIIGATFARGNFPKTLPRNSTAWKEFAAEQPDAVKLVSYEEKQAVERKKQACSEVEELTRNWETGAGPGCGNLKESDPNYWDPESEDESASP